MKKAILSIMYFILLFGIGGCDKKIKDQCEGDRSMEFNLQFTLNIYPDKDTIAVGDTIWVEVRTENPILNQWNNKKYDISMADFRSYIGLNDLMLPVTLPVGGYQMINENGNTNDVSAKITLKLDSDSSLYWKQGFVMNTKGLFFFQIDNFSESPSALKITECKNSSLKIMYFLNGEGTAEVSNYYLFQYSLDESVRNYSKENVAKAGLYAFCVN